MIHNFINNKKYFSNENLKNVLHIVFSKYDQHITINGLNSHIETVVNTIYNYKNVDDLYHALQTMQNKSFTHEYFEEIDDSNRLISNTNNSKNAKKTLENKKTDATNIIPFSTVSMPVTVTTTKMKTALTDKAKKTLEHKVSSLLENKKTDATTVPVTVDTTKMKTDLTDKAKEILETKIKEALNKPAIMVTDVDENRIKEALTDKAKKTFNTDVLFKITNNSSDKVNPTQVIGVAPNNDTFVTEEMNYLSNTAKYMEEINICKKFPRKRFGIANPGTQCYSNAIFQMLYSMPTTRQIFTTYKLVNGDEDDTILLLVKRCKYIYQQEQQDKNIFEIDQNNETCLAQHFKSYTRHQDPGEFFTKNITAQSEVRIYKYIFDRYNNSIDKRVTISDIASIPLDEKRKVNESIKTNLKKLENYTESNDNMLDYLYNKYLKGKITKNEKEILFNTYNNVNFNVSKWSNIINLFDFLKSFNVSYVRKYTCADGQQVNSRIEEHYLLELPIINDKIYNIQHAIIYDDQIEILDEANKVRSDGCKERMGNEYSYKTSFTKEIPDDNKYLIIRLKRWGENLNKTTKIVEPNEKITVDNILYTLTGVICHSGDVNTGHYFYYEYDHNGYIQYCYNDTNVNELEEGEVDKPIYDYLNTSNENYYVSNLTEEQQMKIAIDNSMKPQDNVNVSHYTNKKEAKEYIEKNGYIFLYSRYPVDQYNPENTVMKLIEPVNVKDKKVSKTGYLDNNKIDENLPIDNPYEVIIGNLNAILKKRSDSLTNIRESISDIRNKISDFKNGQLNTEERDELKKLRDELHELTEKYNKMYNKMIEPMKYIKNQIEYYKKEGEIVNVSKPKSKQKSKNKKVTMNTDKNTKMLIPDRESDTYIRENNMDF